MEINRNLSLHVLNSLPIVVSGAITPPGRYERTVAVNILAATSMPTPRDLMSKAKKLQSMFSDKTSRVSRNRLMQPLAPKNVIRIHSVSDKGAAIIQACLTFPSCCFQSLDFNVLLYLRLGIPIAAVDVKCSQCASTQISNRLLVKGSPHKDCKHRKHKVVMTEIENLCKASNALVSSSSDLTPVQLRERASSSLSMTWSISSLLRSTLIIPLMASSVAQVCPRLTSRVRPQ